MMMSTVIIIMLIAMKLCQRCGWEWMPRITRRPAQCPRCKSPKWDEAPGVSAGGRTRPGAGLESDPFEAGGSDDGGRVSPQVRGLRYEKVEE